MALNMTQIAIDKSRIDAMVAQLRNAAVRMETNLKPDAVKEQLETHKADFASALKASMDQVNQVQHKAEDLAQRFTTGDDKVNLSDVMISMQKANIAFQTTVQVRNKLVSAYHDIMNMQI